MLFNPAFWEAVALGIEAENKKIDIFVTHNLSRGVAREALLRSIIVNHTPDPYKVRSGFVYTSAEGADPAKQCDILVFNPQVRQPYYQIDDFVVVSKNTAKQIVEVKSTLNDDELEKIMAVAKYAREIPKPILAFIYGGWTFNTFCQKVRAIAGDMVSLPDCLVVHDRDYLAVRIPTAGQLIYLLIDFSAAVPPTQGMATAYFLNMYEILLEKGNLPNGDVLAWFYDSLTRIPAASKRWITPDGILHDQTEPRP